MVVLYLATNRKPEVTRSLHLVLVSVTLIAASLAGAVSPGSATVRPAAAAAAAVAKPAGAQPLGGVKPHIDKTKIDAWIAALKRAAAHRKHLEQLWAILIAHGKAEQWRHDHPSCTSGCVQGIQVCNGSTLPTCHIVARESGFNPVAQNPSSSASGLYQFIDSTWRHCGLGYAHAKWAPVAIQVACARIIWDNGRGSSNWALTR